MGYLRSGRVNTILPALIQGLPIDDFEVHLLVGHSRVTMALWMIASFVAQTQRNWRFVFHDDGTLSSSDSQRIRELLPSSRVLLEARSTPIIEEKLRNYPLCLYCRNLHPLCRKLFDIPVFASADHVLAIDSDILFFKRPTELLGWVANRGSDCLFMEDVSDMTLPSAIKLGAQFKTVLARKINTGIVAVPKAVLSLELLEECLESSDILKEDKWFIEQSLYAICSSVYGRVGLLPSMYFMPLIFPCPADAVARHYVGAVRHLFYSEGVNRMMSGLESQQL